MNKSLELRKVFTELDKSGIGNMIDCEIQEMPNDRDKMKKHIVARWMEYSAHEVEGLVKKVQRVKIEEMGKYFDAELFAGGITQRADYIRADREDIKEYLREQPMGHPALYSMWLEKRVSVEQESKLNK